MSERKPAKRALTALFTARWAITKDALETMVAIASRQNLDPDAVAAELGRDLDNTRTVTVRNGVATIPVTGPLFRFANMFTEVSGATSIDALSADFQMALDSPRVNAIVLAIDSPGGEVDGVSEFAQMVFDARGMKPIVAHVDGLGASGAYWIASAADQIVASDTSLLGSIGVLTTLLDTSVADEMAGIRFIDIVSSQSPNKTIDPNNKEDLARVQSVVDELADIFIMAVARNRSVSKKTVLSDFGQGDVLVGRSAVKARLADRVGKFEDLHAQLEAATGSQPQLSLGRSAATPSLKRLALAATASPAAAACYQAGLLSRFRIATGPNVEELMEEIIVKRGDLARRTGVLSTAPDEGVTLEDRMKEDKTAAAPSGADQTKAVEEARTAERERVNGIRVIHKDFPQYPVGRIDVAIADGTPVADVRADVLTFLKDGATPLEQPGAERVARNVRDREAEKPFSTMGEQLIAVASAARDPRVTDKRLRYQAAATGLGETVPADGGFALQTDFSSDLDDRIFASGAVLSRVRRTPIGPGANGLKRLLINETSRVDGSRAGGVRGYWQDEGAATTASAPKFRVMEQTLNKLFALVYATDELLEDSVAMQAVVDRELPEELQFKAEDAIINGDGAGKPLGVLSSPALITQTAESGQTTSDLRPENFVKMYARMPARSVNRAVWLHNQDVLPQLLTAGITFGTGGQSLFMPAGFMGNPFNTILGRPMVPIEYCATLDTVGDIIFADLDRFEVIEKGGIRDASSMHVRFLNDEMTFRFTWRLDGQTIENSAVTPFKGTVTVSPFIALATRT